VGKVFRDGPVKPGRLREFIQCDADVVGLGGQEIEAELLSLFAECYQALGIHAIIEINNNKILRGALLQQGFEEKDLDSLILSIDKLKKIGEHGVLDEIGDKGFSRQEAADALQLVQMEQVEELEPLATQQELIEGIQELRTLRDMLEKLNVPYRVNLSMARGLNYYTGNIWEAYERNEIIASSIGSGGRYDKGIGNYVEDGNSYPAVGISFGIIPILTCMDHSQQNGVSDVVVVPLERRFLGQAFAVARQLHAEDMNAELYYGYKLKKAFEYADYLGARYLAIIGEKDCSESVYTLRDLSTKEEWKKALPEFHENL
jgi:histidyl-tRNA synthetase